MHEIDFDSANFEDIWKFTSNLLGEERSQNPNEYEARIAYFVTTAQILVGRKVFDSAELLAAEVSNVRRVLGGNLEKLERTIERAAAASDEASRRMATQSARMVSATWGLVGVTALLFLATAVLAFYTRELVLPVGGAQ